MNIINVFILSFFQSGAYIISSRARNSESILYDVVATLIFNVFNIFTIKIVLDNIEKMLYPMLIGAALGSAFFHWFIVKYVEKYFK